MRKFFAVVLFLSAMIIACSCSGAPRETPKSETTETAKRDITFKAELYGGKEFDFTLNPDDAVSYKTLRDNVTETSVSASNWNEYFDIKEVYREHYEYDDRGNKTSTYRKGKIIMTVLKDDFIYVDNWSRNGLEWKIYVEGEESMTWIKGGKKGKPSVRKYKEEVDKSGADAMLIMTDFLDSWDDSTQQQSKGSLKKYEVVSASGNLKLLKSDTVKFRKLSDDVRYFAAYGSDKEFFVIFVETKDGSPDRESEYNITIYESDSNGNAEKGKSGNYNLWESYIELMKNVNGK